MSISFPHCKKKKVSTHEGLQLSSRVRSVRSAPHRCSSSAQGPHHTNINSSLSRPPFFLLLFFQPHFSFSWGRTFFLWTWFLRTSSVSFHRHGTSVFLSFHLVCYYIFLNSTSFSHFAHSAECGTIQTALLSLFLLSRYWKFKLQGAHTFLFISFLRHDILGCEASMSCQARMLSTKD